MFFCYQSSRSTVMQFTCQLIPARVHEFGGAYPRMHWAEKAGKSQARCQFTAGRQTQIDAKTAALEAAAGVSASESEVVLQCHGASDFQIQGNAKLTTNESKQKRLFIITLQTCITALLLICGRPIVLSLNWLIRACSSQTCRRAVFSPVLFLRCVEQFKQICCCWMERRSTCPRPSSLL